MGFRKLPLVGGFFYHVYNKSIAEFEIFRFRDEYRRMREMTRFYITALERCSYSEAFKSKAGIRDPSIHGPERVRILAYCLMPTHIHFLLQQISGDGISDFMKRLGGSYAVYFNIKTKRTGPLWAGRFGERLVTTDGDLLHMTRYIHLNPVSAGLVAGPEDWEFSSYHEYLDSPKTFPMCTFKKNIPLTPAAYQKFVKNRADYQRSLQIIKAYLLD